MGRDEAGFCLGADSGDVEVDASQLLAASRSSAGEGRLSVGMVMALGSNMREKELLKVERKLSGTASLRPVWMYSIS